MLFVNQERITKEFVSDQKPLLMQENLGPRNRFLSPLLA